MFRVLPVGDEEARTVSAMKVLVATDGSEPIVRACELLVTMLPVDARVRLLTVLSYDRYPHALAAGEHLADEAGLERAAAEAADDACRDARVLFEKVGIAVEQRHRFGNPVDEILTEAEEWDPTLLVLGRRGVHGVERILGSVSEHVLRRATIPTLMVP